MYPDPDHVVKLYFLFVTCELYKITTQNALFNFLLFSRDKKSSFLTTIFLKSDAEISSDHCSEIRIQNKTFEEKLGPNRIQQIGIRNPAPNPQIVVC
jgi:hypothetical protein